MYDSGNWTSMKSDSPLWQNDWFGHTDSANTTINAGRWAYIEVEIGVWGSESHNSYGYLRAPWNNNNTATWQQGGGAAAQQPGAGGPKDRWKWCRRTSHASCDCWSHPENLKRAAAAGKANTMPPQLCPPCQGAPPASSRQPMQQSQQVQQPAQAQPQQQPQQAPLLGVCESPQNLFGK